MGTVACGDHGGNSPQRYFVNGVGIGFDAATGFVAAKIRWIRGLLLYLIAAIETIFIYYKAPTVRLQFEGKDITQPALMISIMNGRRMGGGFYFAPDGNPADGMFDLCLAASPSRARIFGLIPYFMKGTQATHPAIRTGLARTVRVRAVNGSSLPAHADGETVCVAGRELLMEILPAQLDLIVDPEWKKA